MKDMVYTSKYANAMARGSTKLIPPPAVITQPKTSDQYSPIRKPEILAQSAAPYELRNQQQSSDDQKV